MQMLRSVIGAAFLIVVVSVAVATVETGSSMAGLFFESTSTQSTSSQSEGFLWRALLAGAAMILGVYCGCLHAQLRDASDQVWIMDELRKALRRGDLLRGFLASPILFYAVYVFLEEQPDLVLVCLFAFENGFFCDKILERQ